MKTTRKVVHRKPRLLLPKIARSADAPPGGRERLSVDELRASATEFLRNKGMVREGEIVVFSAGVPVGVSGGASRIKVVKVEGAG